MRGEGSKGQGEQGVCYTRSPPPLWGQGQRGRVRGSQGGVREG